MLRRDVRSAEQALAYITDCTLATISSMAQKKSRSDYEFRRQINIAQEAINWMKAMNISMEKTRAQEIVEKDISVEEWSKEYDVKSVKHGWQP